ncbi:uncharacterized protein LOC120942950 isoform X2 [Rana temporaria]|uniref:uncharacterized protein LOC120942950 isoform X2 n=1 Tax=Rana temporaria TaxID=8407 RepID=UPI001AAD1538|nr:uncharacterized protein LOC120942950 isoform X2 [Rana temporaria]
MSEIEKQMLSKLSQIRQILEETPGLLCSPGQQVQNGGSINKGPGHEVGIFSVEVMDPEWLKAALNSRFFDRWVNKSKYTIFKDAKKKDSISESTFCIFLTDPFMWNLMSSLEKAQELKELGSKPFIVVIDDADDSGDAKKKKILNDLIMSKIYIKDLFLFSKLEKECDFMTYLNNDDLTDSMPIGKDPPVLVPAMPDLDKHVSTQHVAPMMGPLVSNQAVPNPDRHVNTAPAAHMTNEDILALFQTTPNPNKPVSSYHAAHMMDKYENQYPPVLVPAMPDQDGHVSTQHVAPMMGVNILAPPSATLNLDRPVSSHHAAHPADDGMFTPASTIKEGHGNNSHPAHTMGEEFLVAISPTSSHEIFNNSSCPTQIVGVNILALPATLNPDRLASSHHAAHPADDGMFTPASIIKEGHGNNSHPAHTMGEEFLVAISPTSSHEIFNNSSGPTQLVGKDLLLSIPSTSRQRRCAKTSSPANVMGKYNNQEPKTNISIKQQPGKKHITGIFSRSSKEDYSWLVELLTSENFRDSIQDVKPCYISNNGFQRFIDGLSQCTFGILYHTKNRGRINITNVTDSLYDEELECLEQMLGKDNVVVLIDDLEDSSDQEKTRILENQPDIKRLASDLLLISCTQKAEKIQLVRKLKSVIQ